MMMNPYLQHLNRIEFVVTLACTGQCRHCQNGDQNGAAGHIDPDVAVRAVRSICRYYDIRSLMTFGGEPLLYPDVVCAIHKTATEMGIGQRQVITNGWFARQPDRMEAVARALADSGVNDLLLSVDAFHQETIPLEPVLRFAACAVDAGVPVRLQPAWLVSPEDDNPYNKRTREILRAFAALPIPVSSGDVIFPSGNALKYLREYFPEDVAPFSPYEEDPEDIRAVSFEANGNVLNGNIYQTDILEILRTYRPRANNNESK